MPNLSIRNDPDAILLIVRSLLAEACARPSEEIVSSTRLDALKLDSLDRVQLCLELEERFPIRIEEGAARWTTVGEVAAFVEEALPERTP